MALQRKYLPSELKDSPDRQKIIIAVVHVEDFFQKEFYSTPALHAVVVDNEQPYLLSFGLISQQVTD